MEQNYTKQDFLDALHKRILVYDGAMGTNLQSQDLSAAHFGGEQYNGCNDYLVISFPEAVSKVHRSFLAVGVDVIETNTFRSNRITLSEYGLDNKVIEINYAASWLARRLADEYSTPQHQRYVAGSMGPTGKLISAEDPELSSISFIELANVFCEQATGLIRGGVDVLLLETSQDILEVKAAIKGIQTAYDETGITLPIQAQVTLDTTGRMLLGTDITAGLTILEKLNIDAIGLNCSTGPEHMREPIQFLGKNSILPVSCIPNAGLPLNIDGEAVYPMEPEPFADALVEFVNKNNISIVGGCCGTTPEHLKLLIEKLGSDSLTRSPHPLHPGFSTPRLSSAIHALPMQQEPPPFLIGERCNAQGSRKFKRILLAEDYDSIIDLAREQVEKGAHALDISVAVTERSDEANLMHTVVKKLAFSIDAPLVIDTTEPEVMEAALQANPGRCLLNSTHLASGRTKADQVFALAKSYNASVLVLTIDERGMARTAQRKLEVAMRIYDIAVNEHGLSPGDLVFDPLTFTLATGESEFVDSAYETIQGIRLIKAEMPGVMTSLGVSNVSFGLNTVSRPVLNSVMLYHAVRAGLDMAIVNPAQIKPYAEISSGLRQFAEDLIFNRKPDALVQFIEHFESAKIEASSKDTGSSDPTTGMSPQERLQWRILHRHKDGVESDIDEILAKERLKNQHETAVKVLNSVLLPAMKEVGDKFGAGELILPFVLQSAEVMKKAVSYLENYLERKEGISRGSVVLATVYGDVHDIGKNLVKTILANNGYTVIDLGKQVPSDTIITTAQETNADAIGLSALLVSTSKQMPLIVNELHRRDSTVPVLLGGAAINRRFGRRILFTEDGTPYKPGVFYCKDAFEGLSAMDALTDPEKKVSLLDRNLKDAKKEIRRPLQTRRSVHTSAPSSVTPAPTIPQPASWGPRLVHDMPLEIIFQYLPKNELFRLSWGAKNAHGDEWVRLQNEFEERLAHMQHQALKEHWLIPQAVYGYWPVQSDGDDLILYDPDSLIQESQTTNEEKNLEIARFTFPRQPAGERLCLADYFAPLDSGMMDLVALQVVTVGAGATERFDRLQSEDDYTEAYFTHGLAVQTAEATAEYLHRHILNELDLPAEQGKRYSWGYPAIPDLSDHRKVFDLLPAESELSMKLTDAFQLVPEQSTAAIFIHHPDAKYFSLGGSRVEQLLSS